MIERGQEFAKDLTQKPKELKQSLLNRAWESLRNKLDLEMSEKSQNNLDDLNQILLTNSAVLYINHTSKMDAVVAPLMVLSQLPNAEHILGPAGMKHYDPKRDRFSSMGFRVMEAFGIQPIPVVQVDDKHDYGEEREKMIQNLKEKTQEALSLPGSLYGIAPEGTRNKILSEANRGIGYLERYNKELYYLPTAIIYPEFSEESQIIVGTPEQLKDILPPDLELPTDPKERAQTLSNIHMMRLAKMMPEHIRGFYSQPR